LHLALETAQSIFQRLTLLDDDFSHLTFTPNPVRIGNVRKPGRMPVSTANSIARQRAHSKQCGVHAGLVFKRFTPLRRPVYGDSFSQFDVQCQAIFVAVGNCGLYNSPDRRQLTRTNRYLEVPDALRGASIPALATPPSKLLQTGELQRRRSGKLPFLPPD